MPLPVAGEASDTPIERISGGQQVVLVRNGCPVAVVLDVNSSEEAEVAVTASD